MTTKAPPQKPAQPLYLDGAEFGRRLEASGMSQAELVAAAEVDQRHVRHWIKGDYGCGPAVIARLAGALGCKPADLMHEAGRKLYRDLLDALKAA